MNNKKSLVIWIMTVLVGVVVFATVLFMPEKQNIIPKSIPINKEQMNIKEVKALQQKSIKRTNKISNSIIVLVIFMQLLAFIGGASVFSKIKNSQDSPDLKLKRIDSADIFLDLPLYIGLFGTVASFILISFNPQASRLVAYSSTLIGIIISTLMRIFIHYPLKQQLLTLIHCNEDNSDKKNNVKK